MKHLGVARTARGPRPKKSRALMHNAHRDIKRIKERAEFTIKIESRRREREAGKREGELVPRGKRTQRKHSALAEGK